MMNTLIKDPLNLIIAGVGGQGNVFASQLIGTALVDKGYFVTIGETYGASQRGGPVMSHVRISQKAQCAPLIAAGNADVILGLEPMETIRMMAPYGNPNIMTIVNPHPIFPLDAVVGNKNYPDCETIRSILTELSQKVYFVDATAIAMGLGMQILTNIIMVGALVASEALPLTKEDIVEVLRNTFSAETLTINVRALQMGMDEVNNTIKEVGK